MKHAKAMLIFGMYVVAGLGLLGLMPACTARVVVPPRVETPVAVTVISPATPTATSAAFPSPTRDVPTWDARRWMEQAAALIPSRKEDLSRLDAPTCYEITVQIWPEKSTLSGWMRAYYTNRESVPLTELVFRLYPNMPEQGGELTVYTVARDGRPIEPTYQLQRTAMLVPLDPPLPVGERVMIEIRYAAQIPTEPAAGYREFVNQDGIITLAGFYPMIPAYDERGWNVDLPPSYGDVTYADIALFDVTVTLPRSMIVATTGVVLDQSIDLRTQTKRVRIVSGPARDFNLALSPNYQIISQHVGDTLLRSYFRPEDRTGGQTVLRVAAESFRVYSELFGVYPYTELDLAESPTITGGIEYPGLIVLNQRSYQGEASARIGWTVAHEVAHQWWYGLVGNDQVHEPWLDEALTNYSTWLYYERVESEQVAQDLFDRTFRQPAEQVRQNGHDQPIGLSVSSYGPERYGPIVYGKGPLFFHAIREKVGDEVFFTILRTYCRRYTYRIATGLDFLALAEEISQQDLHSLYETWVLGKP